MTEKKLKFETNMGDIVISLYSDMPVTAGNIEKLVNEGFYDGIIFHRVINGFMIQVGCPLGTGTGGPGYNIKDEFVKGHSNVRGTVAMANTGQPDTGGSQFFINLGDNSYLDWDNTTTPYKHPVFGEVTEGMDIVDKIAKLPTDFSDKPKQDAKIIKATVI
ncbi:MAG: peptidylprolyl isomerase [Methanomicrobiaceae archaeon]|nr:peptidylprolyl isomerase [Methanomicrobiaceae archaeon]